MILLIYFIIYYITLIYSNFVLKMNHIFITLELINDFIYYIVFCLSLDF